MMMGEGSFKVYQNTSAGCLVDVQKNRA